MPKRIIKSNVKPKLPTALVKSSDVKDSQESTEAELKFDQEVLWSILQLEKLIDSGKLSEPKRQESIKAINSLRKPGLAKIQKIQLMKSHCKDYKTKMIKEQEEISRQTTPISFQPEALSVTSKGVFVKKKVLTENSPINAQEVAKVQNGFLFNFKDPTEGQDSLTSKVNCMKLS